MSEEKFKTEDEIIAEIDANERMSPQEKAHARFFCHGTFRVKDLDDLTLDAWIEELSKLCFEGRSTLSSYTAERDRRKYKRKQGFAEHSIDIDEAKTNAINVIKERQKKLTRKEQVEKNLKQLLGEVATAFGVPVDVKGLTEKAMSARTMLSTVNKAQNTTPLPKIEGDGKAVFNPFARKKEQEQGIQAAIDSIVNGKVAEPQAPIVGKINNPFAKKAK